MSTKITIRFNDEDAEKIKRLAKFENRSLSDFIRTKLRDSIQSEMKGTKLVERLVRKIEDLPKQSQRTVIQHDDELQREVYKTLRFLVRIFLVYAGLTITMDDKRETFVRRARELEKELGVEF